jgi:hypothetical protein
MSLDTPDSTPRRRVRKDRPRTVPKRPLTLKIGDESYRRLAVHAVYERTSLSALVECLIKTHLTRYRVADLASANRPDSVAS